MITDITIMNMMELPSVKRAATAQQRWEKAQAVAAEATRKAEAEKQRFIQFITEAVDDHPECAEHGWVFHHLNNTLELFHEQIAEIAKGKKTVQQCLDEKEAKAQERLAFAMAH